METNRQTVISSLLLTLSGIIWGLAFVAQRAGMEYVGPFTFNGVRFLLGSLALIPVHLFLRRRVVFTPRIKTDRRSIVFGCALAGLMLFIAASLQQVGIVYTTAGKAGFITGLYVIFVPMLGLLRKHRVGRRVWIGALAAAGGMYLLSGADAGGIGLGDGLVLAGALGWAVHVHIVGWLADREMPLVIAISQFAMAGALSLAVALAAETILWQNLAAAVWPIAYAAFLSTGLAYTLQVVGQRHVDPSRAGIILSLESAFAVLGGWLVLGETLTVPAMAGCALMMAGMLISQIRKRQTQSLA